MDDDDFQGGALQLHPQHCWHSEATVRGDRKGLEALRDGITKALADGKASVLEFAGDGEGYSLHVVLMPDFDAPKWEAWRKEPPYYEMMAQLSIEAERDDWRRRAEASKQALLDLMSPNDVVRAEGRAAALTLLARPGSE